MYLTNVSNSTIGRELVYELVRLGMLIDLSHTSDETASQAIDLAQKYRAPVFWSHSCARALNDISRNVPDELLRRIGTDEDKVDGVVMLNFAPFHLAPEGEGVDVRKAADHVEHIANITGKKQYVTYPFLQMSLGLTRVLFPPGQCGDW